MAAVTKMPLPLLRAPHRKSKSSSSGNSFIHLFLVDAVILCSKMMTLGTNFGCFVNTVFSCTASHRPVEGAAAIQKTAFLAEEFKSHHRLFYKNIKFLSKVI